MLRVPPATSVSVADGLFVAEQSSYNVLLMIIRCVMPDDTTYFNDLVGCPHSSWFIFANSCQVTRYTDMVREYAVSTCPHNSYLRTK